MKISKIIYGFLFIAISAMVIISCKDDEELFPQLTSNPQSIIEIAFDTPELSSFSVALTQAGLDSMLRETTTYSVFGPNDKAFGEVTLPTTQEELENLMLNHILQTVTADFTSKMTTGYLTTMATGPDDLNLSFFINADGAKKFNGNSGLVSGMYDIGATNGILHLVDKVLIPPTVAHHIVANPDYSSFAEALVLADLTDYLNSKDSIFTLFAPNNTAFEEFLTTVNGAYGWSSLADIPFEVLNPTMAYHIVKGANNIAADLDGTSQTTEQGESFTVNGLAIDDASYVDGNIDLTDIQGVNGIVQGVDKVLLPDEIFQQILSATLNMVGRCEDRGFTTFLEAVEKVGKTDALATDELTAFVPNNDAFVALFAEIENFNSLDDFDTPEELQLLLDLLNYQMYAGILQESDLPDGTVVTTIFGDTFTVSGSGVDAKLKPTYTEAIPSGVMVFNIGATNGVIHEINRVLVPDALVGPLGFPSSGCGLHPVGDTDLVYFDWESNGPWWGSVAAENDPSHSIDGGAYGRANGLTGGGGWNDLFWRNSSTMNGQDVVADNLDNYSMKFDIKIIEPINAGTFKLRFHSDAVDAFYDWAPWNDTGEPFDTDGEWITIEIPLVVLGQPNYAEVNQEFGMAFDDGGSPVMLNFTIDNMRFDAPGNVCGPDPVDDPELVFYDWDANGPWWGAVAAEGDPAISLDGTNYGRINGNSGGGGWNDMFWRNSSTMNGQDVVADNIDSYVLKFDINTLEPVAAGTFKWRFHSDAVDAFYDWAPWNDTGEPLDTDGKWVTITIPLSVIGQPNYAEVNQEFGMAFDDGGNVVFLNFAIDNVRFEQKK